MAVESLKPQTISPAQPQGVTTGTPVSKGSVGGADFKKALEQFSGASLPGMANGAGAVAGTQMPGLAKAGAAAGAGSLKFSAHAVERMRSRGIMFGPDDMKSIEAAVGKAAQKGSKDTLVLKGDAALIVSVKNNTVVTVMDREAMRENVFTNIDSTVVI